MLYHSRIDVKEGIDPAKSINSKECMIRHCCSLNFVFNDCHDLYMLCVYISHVAIMTV